MTIDELYKFIQFIANKEQRGFIKPSEFNMLAERAQIDLIHDRVARYKSKDQPSQALEQNHSVLDDIRSITVREKLVYNNIYGLPFPNNTEYTFNINSDGAFSYPGDYLHFIRLYKGLPFSSILQSGTDTMPAPAPDIEVGTEIKLLTHDQFAKRKSSSIVPIDINNPVAIMTKGGFEIFYEPGFELTEVWNTEEESLDSQNIFLVYIKQPHAPRWGYQMVNDMYVFDPSSNYTQQLLLPEKTHSEIAQRMLSYIGISLRDNEPLGYAEAKMKEQKR